MTTLPAPKPSLEPLIVRGPFQQSLPSGRDFKRDDNRPLQKRPETRAHPRFGNYSHHSFFARHVACPKRVRHIKGLNDQLICAVVDEGFDNPRPPSTQSMPSFPNSFSEAKMSQYGLPVHNRLSGDALTTMLGTMFAKVRPAGFIKERAVPPMGRWNTFGIVPDTESWRTELRDMLRALGLSQSLQVTAHPSIGDKQSRPATQQGRPTTRDIVRPPNSLEHIISERDSEVLVFQILCQILQTGNPQDVQIWLRSSSPREKQLVLNLVRVALDSMQEETLPAIEEGADVDAKELSKEIEKLSFQAVQPVDRQAERPQSRFIRQPAPSRQEPRRLEPLVEKLEQPEKPRPRTSQVAQPFQSPQPLRAGSQAQSDAGTQTERDVVVRLKYSEPRRDSVLLTAEYLRDRTWAPSNSIVN